MNEAELPRRFYQQYTMPGWAAPWLAGSGDG